MALGVVQSLLDLTLQLAIEDQVALHGADFLLQDGGSLERKQMFGEQLSFEQVLFGDTLLFLRA